MGAIEIAAHLEILGDTHGAEHVALLGHEREAEPADLRRSLAGDILVLEQDMAGARPQQAGDQLEQRRLACAIGSDERHDLAGLDVQVGTLDDVLGGRISAAEAGDPKQAHAARRPR
jgi:hypothetical protein